MSDFRVVVSDTKTGKAYQVEVSGASAGTFIGKTIGGEVDGNVVGLAGYTLKITGGSDKGGGFRCATRFQGPCGKNSS